MQKKIRPISIFLVLLCSILLLSACSTTEQKNEDGYISVDAGRAKEIMDTTEGYLILDVRTKEEYDAGHIPGAVLIPDYEIEARAADELPNLEQTILVYCRSGRRSKIAAKALADMGYTQIVEFGGIIDWPYETTTTP